MKISIERLLRGCNRWARRMVGCAVLAVAASSALAEAISDSALQQISALQAEKASRTPAQQKMDSQLIYALKQSLNQVIAPGVANLRVLVYPQADGRVTVDLKATVTQDLLDFIHSSGGSILSSVPGMQAVRALVPLSLTETLAGRADVQFVQTAVPSHTRTGSVDSEGDTTHRAADARQAFGVNGLGVKVGVLSDSVDYMSQAVGTGDLPPNVTVLPGQSGMPGSGEGTAMLEIVYDLAPGAQLFFATGFGGPASFAQNILNLRAAGCDIIVDDVFYLNESPFQDAVIAQAVNSVTASGALYFSAAGNEGNLTHGTSGTWEGDFVNGGPAGAPVNGKAGNLHSFGTNTYDTVTGLGMGTILLWSDPLGASTNDYDLYVLDSTGATVVSASTTIQNGTQDPFEMVAPPAVGERVVVVQASGVARFLHIDTVRGQLGINTAGNITGHATATNAFACSAVDVHTAYPGPFTGGAANPVEYFSSDGPRRVFFNVDGTPITPGNFLSTGGYVRQKPDISAADGVSTTLPAFSGLNPFYGTSAAAPHAAAIAALLKSFNPALTPSAMRGILTSTALDIEAPGYDFNSGYGIVMAYPALQAAPPLNVPVLLLVTNVVSGGNGNGIIDFNECNDLSLILTNARGVDATGVRATLSTTTPGVIVAQAISTYPNIPVGGGAVANQTPFKISTLPSLVCGTPIDFTLVVKCDQITFTNQFRLTTGVPGTTLRYDNSTPAFIPDVSETNSFIVVTNVSSALSKVTVALYITHTYDSDLLIQLISPDGTTNTLSANNGSYGQNYGAACSPDDQRTTFDDDATNSIAGATAPFVGSFQPQTPLSVFVGKAGTNVNGTWRLRVADQVAQDVGTLQCWSLFLTPWECKDGGGECPGADLALGMTAQPEPVIVSNLLTYTITVTNGGPSTATNVSVTHLLPSSVNFVSAVSSQGSCSQAGGLVTGNLGILAPGAGATVTVIGMPTTVGTFSSTASVTSSQPDPNPANNSATVISHVNPVSADLVAGIVAAPNPILLGGTLIYTVSVTNRGPSASSGVVVGNAWPPSITVLSATTTQGTITPGGNVWTVGSLPVGAGATATITALPTQEGSITATTTAQGNELDPLPANNTASVTTVVGPAADLAISITDSPNPAVVLSNVTYIVTVSNLGPSVATSVGVSDFLPVNAPVLSTTPSQGTIAISGTALTWSVGTLASGAKATLKIIVTTITNGVLTTSATVAGAQTDPNLTNNFASATTQVAPPGTVIVAAGALLTAESYSPPNGAIDVGETVTVILRLRNSSNVTTVNLVGTLMTNDGVSPLPPNPSMNYRDLEPSDVPVGRPFTFTATGTNGQTIQPTLLLQDGATTYPPVSFTFTLSSSQSYSNTSIIVIPDPAVSPPYPIQSGPGKPYPSVLTVSNFNGVLGRVTVTLSNLTHTDSQDINVLLVSPTGAKALLLSHAGDESITGVNLTFDDSASGPLPDSGQLGSGVWQPTAYGIAPSFPANAPAGPYPVALSTFNGGNPNGTWSLYVLDDAGGDSGNLFGGWSLTLTAITPVNQLADLGLSAVGAPNPVQAGAPLTYTFTVANTGPGAATFVYLTNAMPAGVTLLSASPSQGTATTNANTVLASLGTLNTGAVATVTVVVVPARSLVPSGAYAALLTNTATVGGLETDPNPANNTASAVTTVGLPVADVSVSQSLAPNPVATGNNLTNIIVVTNLGPGTALAVVLTDPLPTNTTLVSVSSMIGSSTTNGGTVTCSLGDLAANAGATVTVVMIPWAPSVTNYVYTNAGPAFGTNISTVYTNAAPPWYVHATNIVNLTNTAYVATSSQDTNSANNTATTNVNVLLAVPTIISVGAVLTFESGPVNGQIDPAETVTLALSLANVGSRDTTNLTSILQASGGVTASQTSPPLVLTNAYGALIHGGPATNRSFTFKAAAVLGSAVVATLQLQEGTNSLGTATFTFSQPSSTNLFNASSITIPDHGIATPYPATIAVSNLIGVVTKATVTLNGLSHSYPHDVSALLVSPAGGNVLLMSHTGGGHSLTNPITLSFDDAATNALPNTDALTTGTYRPSAYPGTVAFPSPAPAGPYGSLLAAVDGRDPNGTWSLYVLDDTPGDAGFIAGGWSLGLTTASLLSPLADLAVGISSTPASLFVSSPLTTTVWVTNLGPSTATGVMVTNTLSSGQQVITNIGSVSAGATVKVTIVVAPAVAGNITSKVSVGANEADVNLANNSAQTITAVAASAPAIISGAFVGGQFLITGTAQPGFTYAIQVSSNLASWVSLSTNTVASGGTIKFTDTNSPALQRYYRAKRLSP